MLCLSNLSIYKTTVAQAGLPSKSDSSPEQNKAPIQSPSVLTSKPVTPLSRSQLRRQPPDPSVIQIERIIGAGSFRDGEPRDSDLRKSVFDLFLGQAFEGPVEKKLRTTGEWLASNTESRFRYAGKRILMFVFLWLLPVWTMTLLVACGVLKLPFSNTFLDELLM